MKREARVERWAEENLRGDEFRCVGCRKWFPMSAAQPVYPDPYSPAVCPECAGFDDSNTGERPPMSETTAAEALGNDLAYPWGDVTNGGVMRGLTKRELFAAMAIQGMLGHRRVWDDAGKANFAAEALDYADALLRNVCLPPLRQ